MQNNNSSDVHSKYESQRGSFELQAKRWEKWKESEMKSLLENEWNGNENLTSFLNVTRISIFTQWLMRRRVNAMMRLEVAFMRRTKVDEKLCQRRKLSCIRETKERNDLVSCACGKLKTTLHSCGSENKRKYKRDFLLFSRNPFILIEICHNSRHCWSSWCNRKNLSCQH